MLKPILEVLLLGFCTFSVGLVMAGLVVKFLEGINHVGQLFLGWTLIEVLFNSFHLK